MRESDPALDLGYIHPVALRRNQGMIGIMQKYLRPQISRLKHDIRMQ